MGKEVKSMNNVKVRTKLIIVMLAAFLAMTACVVFSTESMKAMQTKALETIESDKRASYDEMIQNQVDNVISLCQNIYTQYEAGVYTREEAKNWQQMRYVSSDMGMAAISGLISMMEPMLCCLAVRQKARIVWKQRMATVIKW